MGIIPNSLKAGVIIGAGIEALMGELKVGGLRLTLPLQNVMRWGESRWNLFIAVVVLVGLVALFILPLVNLFKAVLPIALSLTLILTAYICIMAGIVAVTLAMPDPKSTIFAVAVGLLLHFLIERPRLLGKHSVEDE